MIYKKYIHRMQNHAVQRYLKKSGADQLIAIDDVAAAIHVLDHEIKKRPTALGYYCKGWVYSLHNMYREALDPLLRAYHINPKLDTLIPILCKTYLELELYKPAIDLIEEIKSSEEDPEIQYLLAKAYYALNDPENALIHVINASILEPSCSDYSSLLGQIYYELCMKEKNSSILDAYDPK